MSVELFNFCPERNVPVTLPREPAASIMTMGAWQFSSRPTTPYQRRFRVTLHGLTWYLNADGTFDSTTNANFNARALERFYERHETWKPFTFRHQHFGDILCRFNAALEVPAGVRNSGGRCDPVDVMLIQHNPGYNNG